MGILPVAELGAKIERAWRDVGYELSGFPSLCGEALESGRLHKRLDPADVIAAVFGGQLPQQNDPRGLFGQPPVTLFRASRFFIDALFWVDGTTAIHDHSFSGAFQVLAGSSIETTFAFASRRNVDGHLHFGDLSVRESTLHRTGSVRAIPAGPGYIHSLFHLARPSVSLVVRTFGDPTVGAQFEYSPAGIGYDSFMQDPGRDRILQVVEMLRKTDHPAFDRIVGDLIASLDLHTAFSVIRACNKVQDNALIDRLVDRTKGSENIPELRSWVRHRRRIEFLVSRRGSVREEDLRFFMAILLNAQRRSDALGLVARYSTDMAPADQIAAWVRRLSEITVRLQLDKAVFEPNLLGLPAFGPGCEAAFSACLAGREGAATELERQFLDTLKKSPPLAPLFIQ